MILGVPLWVIAIGVALFAALIFLALVVIKLEGDDDQEHFR
jgi:hypothetical protein